MTLRQKLVIAFGTVAVVVAVLVGAFTYGLTAHNLRIEVDRSMATAATTLSAPGTLPLVTAAAAAADQQQITRRLTGLTEVAERVSSTGHLDVEIPPGGRDEVGRLSTSLQAMLAELARSRGDQHRLLQKAGHELRTPLTSPRTNVSVMRRFDELAPTSQRRLLDDVDGETRELTNVVNQCLGTQPAEHMSLQGVQPIEARCEGPPQGSPAALTGRPRARC